MLLQLGLRESTAVRAHFVRLIAAFCQSVWWMKWVWAGPGGATTTGPDATPPPPQLSVKTWRGGAVWGGVQPGVGGGGQAGGPGGGGGSSRGSGGGGSNRGSGGGLAGGQGGVQPGVRGGGGVWVMVKVTELVEPVLVL